MKKLRYKRVLLILIIITAIVGISLSFLYISKKNMNEVSLDNINITLKEAYEAFIEEEPPLEENINIENTETSASAWIPYWDFNNAFTSYKNNSDKFNSLSPTWYAVQDNGSLELKNTARNTELISLCKNNQTKLIPSISNSNAEILSDIINNEDLLNIHIECIVNEVITYEYDGIDIDYEYIKSTDKNAFTNFIKILSEELHNNNKTLTIAILWKNDLDTIIEQFSESRAAQDWEAIGQYVDEFRIMAYDYTGSEDNAYSISPKDWISSILDYAIEKVDSEKIILGLPLYAYEWKEGVKGARALIWEDVEYITMNYPIIENKLDLDTLEKKLIYESGGSNNVIWYQDSEVTDKRINLAQNYGIYNFIFWRLGGEDPEIYNLID